MNQSVQVNENKQSLVITFNRPTLRNPLSIVVLEQLDAILTDAFEKPYLQKIIFTGVGDVFASGADLREIAEITGENAVEFALRGQNLMSKIAGAPCLIIAAVNGFCFGGALDLALACQRRIAAPDATFCHPGVNLGIITGWGGTQLLPRLIGEAKALEMLLTGKIVTAAEAFEVGLVDLIGVNPLQTALNL